MEEEILRAHRRATKNHMNISACSVLMENLLLQYKLEHEEREKAKEAGAPSVASTSANDATWCVA
jgi:hypothetical protein